MYRKSLNTSRALNTSRVDPRLHTNYGNTSNVHRHSSVQHGVWIARRQRDMVSHLRSKLLNLQLWLYQ